MKRELLEQHFSPEQIKQRAGHFGKTLDYIEGHAVIQRLNDAFDGQWSFQVESHEVLESEVIVLGKLNAENISKSQFGSSTVTRAKNSGDVISLADDLKSAATDSLKKCATMFGIGLHLYSGKSAPPKPVTKTTHMRPVIENDPFSPDPKGTLYCPSSPVNMQFDGGGGGGGIAGSSNNSSSNGSNGNGGNGTGRLSSKQYNYLLSLASNKGLTKQDVDKQAITNYGAAVSFLSKHDASSMIEQMIN